MAKRQKAWARRKRALLKFLMGKKCVLCGSTQKLEFDCIIACGDFHHRMDTSTRVSFYTKEFWAGNLQILCEKCNNKKSLSERNTPF